MSQAFHSRPVLWFWPGLLLSLAAAAWIGQAYGQALGAAAEESSAVPVYRVEAEAFEAREADIRAVLDSAASELWRYFPDYKLEPIVVEHNSSGPIVLYRRNERGELVIRLNAGKTFWCQYAYQFAHELCHVLCGYSEGPLENRWFEETLCETASLFTMRAMARSWKTAAPYPNWANYRDALRDYVDDIERQRHAVHEIYRTGMAAFYQAHQTQLRAKPGDRELNGSMALIMLKLFEENPQRWEAVRWLNSGQRIPGESLDAYLQRWHDTVPDRHRGFIKEIADLYGATITTGD